MRSGRGALGEITDVFLPTVLCQAFSPDSSPGEFYNYKNFQLKTVEALGHSTLPGPHIVLGTSCLPALILLRLPEMTGMIHTKHFGNPRDSHRD